MVRALEGIGLRRIEPVKGDAFDATLHQAISQQPSDEVKPGAIVSVASIGYALGDRVLRPARVVVRPSEGVTLEVKGSPADGGCACGPSCCGGNGKKGQEQRDADV
jgi:molecular chaperone GrpE